jgi:hypothetical protein
MKPIRTYWLKINIAWMATLSVTSVEVKIEISYKFTALIMIIPNVEDAHVRMPR